MRKLFVSVLLTALCLAANAQVAPGIVKKHYSELKGYYNPREYVPTYSDKYSPGWSGVASFVIPGLGQAICGEWGKAAGQFLGNIALNTAAKSFYADEKVGACLLCFAGAVTLDIYSIVDAVKIAKVKNMYLQDSMMRTDVNIKLQPYFASVNTASDSTVPSAGIALKIEF